MSFIYCKLSKFPRLRLKNIRIPHTRMVEDDFQLNALDVAFFSKRMDISETTLPTMLHEYNALELTEGIIQKNELVEFNHVP